MEDPYRLERFIKAQDARGIYSDAVSELRAGRKSGHWMWFIFPQIKGLGTSANSRKFAISSLAEAQAYLQHPLLGTRLMECAQILLSIKGNNATEIFGPTDAMKLHSSMTLFMAASSTGSLFGAVLTKYFHGTADKIRSCGCEPQPQDIVRAASGRVDHLLTNTKNC